MDGDRIRKPHAMQWLVPQRIGDATHHRRARSRPSRRSKAGARNTVLYAAIRHTS